MALLIDILAAGVIDGSGDPLDSGKVYVYQVGTTTPVTTYQDSSLTQPNSNPIILDSVGKAEVYINEDVRLVIEDADGANIADIDAIGTNTELLGGTTTIGNSSSDVVEFNSSIAGDLIPTVDDTYDVGSTSKKWAEGHFDELNATSLDVDTITGGSIQSIGANTPNWISNIGIKLDAGILSITDSQGQPLTINNPGYITCQSVTSGELVSLKVTQGVELSDFTTGSSNFTNFDPDIIDANNYSSVTFYIGVANKADSNIDGIDGNSAFYISRSFEDITPSVSTSIGDSGAIPADPDNGIIMLMGSYTIADYINLPSQAVARIRMSFDSSNNDWTFLALNKTDGVGRIAPSTQFANQVWENYSRSTGTSVGIRGVAISSASGVVSETTTTDQSLGITATIEGTGRPIFVGLSGDDTLSYIGIDTGTTTNPITCRIKIKRNGTEIYDTSFTAAIAGSNDTFQIPPSSVWTIDTGLTAGTSGDYTASIALVNTGTSAGCNVSNVKIVAYEL